MSKPIIETVNSANVFETVELNIGGKIYSPLMFAQYHSKYHYWWKRVDLPGKMTYSSKMFKSLVAAKRDFIKMWVSK